MSRMVQIIKELRIETNSPLGLCKEAYDRSEGDKKKAIGILESWKAGSPYIANIEFHTVSKMDVYHIRHELEELFKNCPCSKIKIGEII